MPTPVGGRIEDILASLRELPDVIKKLTATIEALKTGRGAIPSIGSAIIDVYTVSFNGHEFQQTIQPLGPKLSKHVIQHPYDAIIVQGSYDYQVEYDKNVEDLTPITPALQYQNFSLHVNKYLTYKISPAVINQLGQNIEGKFFVYGFWRE